MNLDNRSAFNYVLRRKNLAVDGAILGLHLRSGDAWLEFSGNIGAVTLANKKSRSELHEQSLFQFVGQAVLVGINLRVRGIDL